MDDTPRTIIRLTADPNRPVSPTFIERLRDAGMTTEHLELVAAAGHDGAEADG